MTKPRQPSLDHFSKRPFASGCGDDDSAAAAGTDPRLLLDTSLALVDEGLDVLALLEDDGQFRQPSALIPGGSVGKHFRHVIETFDAFLLAFDRDYQDRERARGSSADAGSGDAESSSSLLLIDYDALLPATRAGVARSLGTCRTSMRRVRDGLASLASRPDTELNAQLAADVDVIAVTPTRQTMKSTLARELWFCALHTIHHYTMIRTICVHELGLHLPVEFGTAPATLVFRPPDWKPPHAVWKAKL